MGTCKLDLEKSSKRLEEGYNFRSKTGILKLLKDITYIRERQYFRGDYAAVILFADLQRAVNLANLTRRQRQALHYLIQGYNYREIGEVLEVSVPAVKKFVDGGCKRIQKVFIGWDYEDRAVME